MSQSAESTSRTLLIAFILCVVCSAIVATTAVLLKPRQIIAKENDRNINILQIGGLYEAGKPIAEQMQQVSPRVINFDTGRFTDEMSVAQVIDPKKLARDPSKVTRLKKSDPAKLIRRENFGVVYVVEKEGRLDRIILPIRGYGLWSTLWGFVALEPDLNTVIGLGYYQHAETPGLGGEVDNPKWKALWAGKQLFSGSNISIKVIKGEVDPADPEALHKVDGLSGATLTAKGVDNMLQFWLSDMGYGNFLKNLKAGEA
jgi:Na+-transporting NADH:ubiquinone oxidoreductase subunit C